MFINIKINARRRKNHMKTYLLSALLLFPLFFIACKNENDGGDGGEENTEEAKKKISKRDKSISISNSYSTLFLDSLALEAYLAEKKIPDSISRRMRSFYNTRNYQYAWFSGDGLTEQARGFWNLHDYHTSYVKDSSLSDKALTKRMDALIAEEELSVNASNKSILNTEIQLTQHFIHYMRKEYEKGFVKRKEMERFVPYKKRSALEMTDSIIKKKHKDDKYFEDVNMRYGALKQHLNRYYNIVGKGGWPSISIAGKSLKKGSTAAAVLQLKKQLQMTGDLAGTDSSQVFNDTLEMAVKNFQIRHGYTPDGVVGSGLIKELNVPAATRLQQILMNMERMRWMPNQPKSENLIVVNIPEFELHMYERDKIVWSMNVVVGKEGHNTMMFTGDLNQVVFSPHWNVPESIVKDEILPAIEKNPDYLAIQNMEIVKHEGEYPTIRQLPGGKNALGNVKFLFPNSFDIYFHDTPAKSLFSMDKRAYSHGCIRLSNPEKMVTYLLRHQPEWTPEKIYEAMNAGEEKFVRVKKPVPVFISYNTAWADENGQLNFREDIYGHDKKLAKKMFNQPEMMANR